MSLDEVREQQMFMAMHEAEDSDDEDFTSALFQGYNDGELEALRQRQIGQMRRYYGRGGRGEIPGVPAFPTNSESNDFDISRAANTNADFDRMLHEIETCHAERFRE